MAMRIRKYHPHKSVLFVTFSVEEGLFLLANPLCKAIVQSCLGAAQALYPVTISHFVIQSTHVHLLMTVYNPDDVKDFIRHFKTETAHLFNNLLGRAKRTIWCEGYDSPIVLCPEKAMSIIAYIYANPVKDNLIGSIDLFPGLSSWKMFLKGEHTKKWKRIRRDAVRALPHHSLKTYTQESERLLSESKIIHEFSIHPNAWLEAFGITDPEMQKAKNQEIVERVRSLEQSAAAERQRPVRGREALLSEVIDLSYRPQRSGKRTCCLSEDKDLRIRFIEFLKALYAQAAKVADRWRLGDFSLPFPPGCYPPSFPKLAEPLAAW